MNERIKELAEEAGAEFWQRLENDVVKQDAYITFDPPESLEKFAELIVRECIEQVEVFNVRMDARPRHVVEAIKQHFGVEE